MNIVSRLHAYAGCVAFAALAFIAVWVAMWLAFQQPYYYSLNVQSAKAGETTGFQAIPELGQPNYLWGSQYASFELANPGGPVQITVRLGGRTDGAAIPFTLHQKPLGSVTIPVDGAMITHTFTIPPALLSRDSIHLGIAAPAYKMHNLRLSVQVDSIVVSSNPSLGLVWPPTSVLLATTFVAALITVLGLLLDIKRRWLLLPFGGIATYLLLMGRVNVIRPMLGFAAVILLITAAYYWQTHDKRWLPNLSLSRVSASLQQISAGLLTDGFRSMPFFRLAIVGVVLAQVSLYIGEQRNDFNPISASYFVGIALLLVAVLLQGRLATIALLISVVVAGIAIRFYWANLDTLGDVFWANSQASYFVLNGQNPYAQNFTWVPNQPHYPWYGYFPMTIFSQVPFYILGDVRWGLASFDLATLGLLAALVYRRYGFDVAAAATTLLLLYAPLNEYTITNGIVDPVMMFWLVLSFYLLTKERWMWAAITAGLALASKQYALFYIVPLLVYLIKEKRWREAVVAVALPAVIILPFFLWSPADFINDTVILHLSWPPLAAPFAGQWNLALWAQWLGISGGSPQDALNIKPFASVVLVLSLLIVSWLNLRTPSLTRVIGATTVLMTISFALNSGYTQFFYWRDIALLMLAWATVWPRIMQAAQSSE